MTITQVAEQLELTPVVLPQENREVTGCYIGDLLSWVLTHGEKDQIWLTIMGNVNVMAVAKLVEFSVVVLCEDAPLDEQAKLQAEAHHITVYHTPKTMYQVASELSKILT